MKLSKEEIQKVVLGALLAIGVVYAYFDFVLGPLEKKHASHLKELSALEPKIKEAEMQIANTQRLDVQIPQAEATLSQIDAMIPDGSPVAWFPPLMTEYFRMEGVDRVNTRNSYSVADPMVEGYRRMTWSMELPKVELIAFSRILTEFQNKEPLIEITNFSVDGIREDPEKQRVVLTLINTVKQQ